MVGLLLMAPAGLAEEALPPPGFLEFLGSMVESEGEFIDPLSMATPAEEVLIDTREDENEETVAAGRRQNEEPDDE